MRKLLSGFVITGSLLMHATAWAQAPVVAFTDVPSTHPAFAAITYLREQGILKGYSDNTFKPNQQVDRAAALKMILAGRVTEEQAASAANPGYGDIPAGAWYAGFTAKAAEAGIIDPPSKAPNFNGSRPVILAEFLKLLLLAQSQDPNAYSEITLPLAGDVTDAKAWFYPYYRAALAASVVQVDTNGNLNPTRTLTRGDVAIFVHRLLMYKQGRRTQALLTSAETELSGNVLGNLSPQGLPVAKMARARALLQARGALASRSDSPIVKGAVKITEGFGSLVEAYEAGITGKPDVAIAAAGKAWNLAAEAKAFSADLTQISTNIQEISSRMANEARAVKAGGNK